MVRENSPNKFRSGFWRLALAVVSLCIPFAVTGQDEAVLPPDVRLVIDVSGSMKRNDPNNLRQPAVELLVQLLPDNSKAGVWTFGKWVNMLVPHRDVNLQWRESAQQKSASINSVGLFTNIGEALEKAAYDAKATSNTHRKSIILLTDGMVDIDKDPERNKQEWRRIVDEVLPSLKDAGYTIHTIGLSDNADSNLLGKLSLATDGIAEIAHSADELMKIFLKSFDAAVPAEQVPLEDNSFVIDSSVEEFTALIFRNDEQATTELQGPDETLSRAGSTQEGVNWHSADGYDLITVSQPLEGEWLIKADMAPESRVTVVSNLNLRVKPLPNNVYKGQNVDLTFALAEDGNIIKRPEFLSLMDVESSMDAGVNEDDLRRVWSENLSRGAPPVSGSYQTRLPDFDKNGVYEIQVLVDGKSFKREFRHRIDVRQPFAADITEEFNQGKMDYVLTVKSFSSDVLMSESDVVAAMTTPSGSKKFIPLAVTEMDTWRGVFVPEAEGEYLANVRIQGRTKNGEEFDVILEDLRVNYSMESGLVDNSESFFPEPEAKPASEPEKTVEPEKAEEPEAEVETEPEPTVETPPQGLAPWILYTALALGNVVLFAAAFFVYRKLTRKESDEDILDEFSDEKIAEQAAEGEADSEPEPSAEAEPDTEAEAEIDEEPPMEDLEPAMEDLSDAVDEQEAEPAPEPSAPEESAAEEEPPMEEINTEEADEDLTVPDGDLAEPEPAPAEQETALDDLEEMALAEKTSEEVSEEISEETNEDDEMVNEMLKAQGLDLAGDELDDAISSLIDDMENDSKET